MPKFLFFRFGQQFLLFAYVITGYRLLAEEQAVFFYDFVLMTTVLTFAFSNANNWLLKSEDQSTYLQFQILIAFFLSLIFIGIDKVEYIAYIPVMLLKSFAIVQLRIDNRVILIPQFSMLFGVFNLLIIYCIYLSVISFSIYYFFISNAVVGLLLFTGVNKRIIFKKPTFYKLMEVTRYLPIVGAGFLTMSIDRLVIKKIFNPNELLVYAQYEVVSQGILMLLLTVLFYYHKKILVDEKIRQKFTAFDRYFFIALPILILIFGLFTKSALILFDLNANLIIPLFFFKLTAIIVSYYVIFFQTNDKEVMFSTSIVLIYCAIFILTFFQYTSLAIAAIIAFILILGCIHIAKRI